MHSPRAQADKKLYQFTMKHVVEDQPNLTLRQEMVEATAARRQPQSQSTAPRRVVGVVARGDTLYRARAVVLTTGTFLKALMHTGEAKTRGGRAGDAVRRGAERQPRRVRLRAGPLQDRHALPAQRPDHRLRQARAAARRRRPAAVQLRHRADHAAADRLPHHLHERGGPRPDPRQPAPGADVLRPDPEPRAALLPVDRGQGRALRRQGSAPDLPGAGRAATRCEYYCNGISTSLPKDVQQAMLRLIPGPGERRGHALGLRRRVRLRPADAAAPDAGDEAGRRACTSPARSTARPATRRPPPRG